MQNRATGGLLPLLVPALCAAGVAQAALPEAHWGANIYPSASQELRLSLAFNRFTEFSKTGDPSNPSSPRFNELGYSTGFNLATLGWTEQFHALGRRFTGTIDLGGGTSGDQPTRFLQNEYVHKALRQARVPTGTIRE